MRIGLIDVDGHRYPNLVLMKISAWHKRRGDSVEWWNGLAPRYDQVYMSKVFSDTYTPDETTAMHNADYVFTGGTGYAIKLENGKERYVAKLDSALPPEVEHIYPDYSLYRHIPGADNTAYGFLTRGCPRKCPFCHVSAKEGCVTKKAASLSEFWRGQRNIELMDANILAAPECDNLLHQLSKSCAYVNFSQGLDIRLMNREVAEVLSYMRVKRLHFAWDNPREDLTAKFEQFGRWYERKDPTGKIVYVLTNFNSTLDEDLERINILRALGFNPYVMVYNKPSASAEIKRLQRWVNNRRIFNSVPDFAEYIS